MSNTQHSEEQQSTSSLHALVARHLETSDSEGTEPVSQPNLAATPSQAFRSNARSIVDETLQPIGQQLNAVDTQWAAGIEQLLPTPAFRFRVMKERLVRERKELVQQINHYEGLTTDSTQQQTKALRQKLATLQRHETKVDYQLSLLLNHSTHPLSFRLVKGIRQLGRQWQDLFGTFGQAGNISGWIHKLDPVRGEVAQLNQRLVEVTQLTEQRLPIASAAELADLLSTYDDTMARIAALEAQLPTTLWGQWQRLLKLF